MLCMSMRTCALASIVHRLRICICVDCKCVSVHSDPNVTVHVCVITLLSLCLSVWPDIRCIVATGTKCCQIPPQQARCDARKMHRVNARKSRHVLSPRREGNDEIERPKKTKRLSEEVLADA